VYLPEAVRTPEEIAARFAEISSTATLGPMDGAFQQTQKYMALAMQAAAST
jgi:hypothetical protein